MSFRTHIDEPAFYRIRVHGAIGVQWRDYFQGLSISVDGEPDRPTTTLAGVLQDQAALLGVINALYQMNHALIDIRCQAMAEPGTD